MSDILLGGVIGLASALIVQAVVQVFIVPRVQASIRRHDRWEKNLIEFVALVEVELPRAENDLRAASEGVRLLSMLAGDAQFDQDKVRLSKAEATQKEGEADRVITEALTRANRLERHLALTRPKAPYWSKLSLNRASYQDSLLHVDRYLHDSLDDEAFKAGWIEVIGERRALLERIEEITVTMRPPSRQAASRARSSARGRVRKMFRLDRKSEATRR
ncbi:hypothetical protein [Actinoplanes sp. NPDC049118]|uniref:hypothetical protein n=1 Tax=Actinoplanes sp. NPDC049118 TaxID=3155769 RepID=UPI0033D25B8D